MLITEKSLRKIIRSVLLEVPLGFVDTIPKRNSDDAARSDKDFKNIMIISEMKLRAIIRRALKEAPLDDYIPIASNVSPVRSAPSVGHSRVYKDFATKVFSDTKDKWVIITLPDVGSFNSITDSPQYQEIISKHKDSKIMVVVSSPLDGDDTSQGMVVSHDIVGHSIENHVANNQNLTPISKNLGNFTVLWDIITTSFNEKSAKISDFLGTKIGVDLERSFTVNLKHYFYDIVKEKEVFLKNGRYQEGMKILHSKIPESFRVSEASDDLEPDVYAAFFAHESFDTSFDPLVDHIKKSLVDTFKTDNETLFASIPDMKNYHCNLAFNLIKDQMSEDENLVKDFEAFLKTLFAEILNEIFEKKVDQLLNSIRENVNNFKNRFEKGKPVATGQW
jgi:hypothetical protein